ncbi:MAG: AAA family ATPase [Candidatus Pacearchaeota archaeon]|nr:AAA family ATPase [Candidatus Pacearchaeota archaeon]
MSNPKVFGVIALKGGVGKTTVVANLGAALASEFGKRVLIVDANFSTPHLGLHVGLINPTHTLHPVLSDEYSIYEAIYEHDLGFHIIPGRLAPDIVDPFSLKEKLDLLKDSYDVILIDSSPSLDKEIIATMAASDELLVVSSPDYPTLSSTLHAVNIAKRENTPIRGIVLNKVRKKRFELGQKDIASASDIDILASFPDNLKVLAATSKMVPVVEFAPREDISHMYKKLAGSLVGENYKKRRFSRKKEKGKEEIPNA